VISTFDPDDLGAEIGQEGGAPRKHMHLFKGEYPDTCEDRVFYHREVPHDR
jgi:hypothetical protein